MLNLALISASDSLVGVAINSKDPNAISPPLVFYCDKTDAAETIMKNYYLLTNQVIAEAKIHSLCGGDKLDLEKLKSDNPKEEKSPMAPHINIKTEDRNYILIFIMISIIGLVAAILSKFLI